MAGSMMSGLKITMWKSHYSDASDNYIHIQPGVSVRKPFMAEMSLSKVVSVFKF